MPHAAVYANATEHRLDRARARTDGPRTLAAFDAACAATHCPMRAVVVDVTLDGTTVARVEAEVAARAARHAPDIVASDYIPAGTAFVLPEPVEGQPWRPVAIRPDHDPTEAAPVDEPDWVDAGYAEAMRWPAGVVGTGAGVYLLVLVSGAIFGWDVRAAIIGVVGLAMAVGGTFTALDVARRWERKNLLAGGAGEA